MPSTYPPESHYGYVCCKCKKSDFLGRRYACWLCINYQLCGQCYDSGVLPITAEHNYFHPLEAYYTRAEYELYFGGECFVESYVPQSYKCALCDDFGFTSLQLYKHLSDVHRNHTDFDEYFSILYTRYATEFMSGHSFGPATTAAGDLQLLTATSESPRSSQNSGANVRDAIRLTHARQALLLEQQALNVLEELRMVNRSNSCLSLVMRTQEFDQQLQQQHLHQQQPQRLRAAQGFGDVASARTAKTDRVRNVPSSVRLCPLVPKVTPRSDTWARYWAASTFQQQWGERVVTSYADTVRNTAQNVESPDKKKNYMDNRSYSNKFLCVKFLAKKNLSVDVQAIGASSRMRFAQAILCSMLSDDNLNAVELKPLTMQLVKVKPTGIKSVVVKSEKDQWKNLGTSDSCADGHMERFYRGLDNYKKWFAEFMAKKLEVKSKEIEVEPLISDVPNIFQATTVPIIGIDSDMDGDTDEREEDDDDADYKIESIQIRQQVEVHAPVDSQVVEEVADDEENVHEYDDDGYGDNSGSETSDSTIAMMVNVIDQVYGY